MSLSDWPVGYLLMDGDSSWNLSSTTPRSPSPLMCAWDGECQHACFCISTIIQNGSSLVVIEPPTLGRLSGWLKQAAHTRLLLVSTMDLRMAWHSFRDCFTITYASPFNMDISSPGYFEAIFLACRGQAHSGEVYQGWFTRDRSGDESHSLSHKLIPYCSRSYFSHCPQRSNSQGTYTYAIEKSGLKEAYKKKEPVS